MFIFNKVTFLCLSPFPFPSYEKISPLTSGSNLSCVLWSTWNHASPLLFIFFLFIFSFSIVSLWNLAQTPELWMRALSYEVLFKIYCLINFHHMCLNINTDTQKYRNRIMSFLKSSNYFQDKIVKGAYAFKYPILKYSPHTLDTIPHYPTSAVTIVLHFRYCDLESSHSHCL